MGCTTAIVFTCFGAAYGTAKAGIGLFATSILCPDMMIRSTSSFLQQGHPEDPSDSRHKLTAKRKQDSIPVVMADIVAVYGLVVSVLISNDLRPETPLYTGFLQLGSGLSVGLAGLAAGFAIGIVGDAGVRGTAQQPRTFVAMVLILIFAEVLGESVSGEVGKVVMDKC